MKKKISFIAMTLAFVWIFALPAQAAGHSTIASVFIGGVELQPGLGLLIGAVLAIIICLVLRAGMKSVRPKGEARDYVVGQLQLSSRHDQYTHTTTHRTKINSDNSKR